MTILILHYLMNFGLVLNENIARYTYIYMVWDIEPTQLSPHALSLCKNPHNQLVLSVVSVWEMEIKIQLGKLYFVRPLADMIAEQQHTNNIEILPATLSHVLALETLPPLHKDPFDRLLIAQAKVEGMPFISRDQKLEAYPIDVQW